MPVRPRIAVVTAFVLLSVACVAGDTTGEDSLTAAPPADTSTTVASPLGALPPQRTRGSGEPLVIWADQPRTEALRAAGEQFTTDTGIPVVVELRDIGSTRTGIEAAVNDGSGPDLFIGGHDWVGVLEEAGVLAEVDLSSLEGEFFPIATEAFALAGATYGLPLTVETMGLCVKPELVTTPPRTWGELISICDGIPELAVCIAAPAGNPMANLAFIQGFGGYVFGLTASGFDSADVGLDTEAAFRAAAWLDSAVQDGYLSPDVDWGTMNDVFAEGRAPFLWNGPWHLPELRALGVPYGVMEFPPVEGNHPAPMVNVQGLLLSAGSDQQEAARLYVTEYVASPAAMMALFDGDGRAPAMISVYEAAVASTPELTVFAGVDADPADLVPNIPEVGAIWPAVAEAMTVIYEQAYDDETPDPAAAMARAAEKVRAAIDG